MSIRYESPAMLTAFARNILRGANLGEEAAEVTAQSLVDADRHGVASHGLIRLPIYVERLQRGMIDPDAIPSVTTRGARAQVNGHNAIGSLVASRAVDAACALSEEYGIGASTARRSNHCGTMGFYARRAAQDGHFVIAASNAPATMAYHGGRTPAVGTNPLAIAVPRLDGPPVVLDIASSAVARGKIIVAHSQGETIPLGWALDSQGQPTTVAADALDGTMLPFGGPKGSGIALMIDLLCGVLSGGPSGPGIGNMYEDWDRPQDIGHTFIVSQVDTALNRYGQDLEDFLQWVRALPPAEGCDAVRLPGDIEQDAAKAADREGIPLAQSTWATLNVLAESLGVKTIQSQFSPPSL